MQTIGRYVILRQLGQGGMSTVFLAKDPDTGLLVAVKILPSRLSQEGAFRARLRREAQIITTLQRVAPIVPLHDVGADGDEPHIVMAYMAGGTLGQRIAGGPLPPARILPIVQRIAEALDAAHKQGIIHRDLKPSNVLFDGQERAYLADFGIAKLLLESRHISLTGTAVIGTPSYMSPEQVVPRGPIDGRSDVYALGIMLYEMLTGQVPYAGETPIVVMLQHIRGRVPRLTKRDGPTLVHRSRWNAILSKSLAKNPDKRYASAGALAADVSRLVAMRANPRKVATWNQPLTRAANRLSAWLAPPKTTRARTRQGQEATSPIAARTRPSPGITRTPLPGQRELKPWPTLAAAMITMVTMTGLALTGYAVLKGIAVGGDPRTASTVSPTHSATVPPTITQVRATSQSPPSGGPLAASTATEADSAAAPTTAPRPTVTISVMPQASSTRTATAAGNSTHVIASPLATTTLEAAATVTTAPVSTEPPPTNVVPPPTITTAPPTITTAPPTPTETVPPPPTDTPLPTREHTPTTP